MVSSPHACPTCGRCLGGMATAIIRSVDPHIAEENARLTAENKRLNAEVFRLRNQQRRKP